ncbi:MAG: hypothetical protein NC341_10545 [Blautia sp.]|nr:hypothetical protein [Blautia sp.]MCM1202280.1 hypothetical protein [Bacteroides fragilis]
MSENKNMDGKMPGEISLPIIELGMDCRKYLQWYYAEGGYNAAFGEFKGRIIKINRRGILFKRLYVDFMEGDGTYVKGKEDHIWVFDKRPFFKARVKVGDCVSFTGKVYAYRRQDESIDFSLKDCEDIKKIDSYVLPSDEELDRQSLERIACETCLYSEQCCGFCIAPVGWREARIEVLQKIMKCNA